MKKMKNTRYAHIGTSYTPRMDAEIDRLEAAVLAREVHLNEMFLILKIKGLLDEGENFTHWGE